MRSLPSGRAERVFIPVFGGRPVSLEGSFHGALPCVSHSAHTRPAALRAARPSPPDRTACSRSTGAGRRTREVDAQPVILLCLPDRPAVTIPEIEATEQHLTRLIDDLLG